MSADEYTPTAAEVRYQIVDGRWATGGIDGPGFDRFVAEVARTAKAEAWDECIQGLAWCLDNGPPERAVNYLLEHNPYRKVATDE